MWHIFYLRALDIANERIVDAERQRWAQRARSGSARGSRIDGFRRQGALVAAGLARRLDERVAREALKAHRADDPLGSAT
jgi:hypothetical protein